RFLIPTRYFAYVPHRLAHSCISLFSLSLLLLFSFLFFFNDPATTEIYTLSLHDALPIASSRSISAAENSRGSRVRTLSAPSSLRSEEHTSELQSRVDLVCRLLLEKKKNNTMASEQSQY